jgi:hypothetical protein
MGNIRAPEIRAARGVLKGGRQLRRQAGQGMRGAEALQAGHGPRRAQPQAFGPSPAVAGGARRPSRCPGKGCISS